MIKTFLFDMDGVFCAYDFRGRLQYLEKALGVSAAEIDIRIFESGLEDRADSGTFSTTEYLSEVSRLLETPVSHKIWLDARVQSMTPWPEMFDLARQLQTNHEIALLTNNGWFLAESIGDILPELPTIFGDHLYFSAQLGGGKDTPTTFTRLLAELDWSPETTLFIDDSATYIASAKDAGLHTHHFTTCDILKADLRHFGVL